MTWTTTPIPYHLNEDDPHEREDGYGTSPITGAYDRNITHARTVGLYPPEFLEP